MPTALLPGDSTQGANASSATILDPDDRAVHSGWKGGGWNGLIARRRHCLSPMPPSPVEMPVQVPAFDID